MSEFDAFLQIPSPPSSDTTGSSPEDSTLFSPLEQESCVVSVSTTFFPGAGLDSAYPEDLIISSPDSVFFCCHSARLLSASQNGFAGYLAAGLERSIKTSELGPVISFPDHSDVLNVLLHALYSMPCSHYSPSNETVRQTLAAMVRYQVPLEAYVNPSSPIFSLFLANAAYSPLEPYAIAASFGLDELASSISVHLVSASLCSINDALANEIGPVYLKRLFFLHLGRTEALKRLLITPPSTHESLPECNPADQKRVTKAWTLAAAYLSWDARPDLSVADIRAALNPLADKLSCARCKFTMRERITELVTQWSAIKRTI